MNIFMPRMLLLACITSLLVLSGCGPKEIEPYQTATEEESKPALATSTTYPLSYGDGDEVDFQEEKGAIDKGSIEEENMASLEESLPLPEGGDTGSAGGSTSTGTGSTGKSDSTSRNDSDSNTPVVETLDAGSGLGEQKLGFGTQENQSAAYRKEHGRSSIQLKPVYFDFDKSDIRSNQIANIEHNADYLKSNVASNVLIEGNCDETGTNEYNLALGERRAMNARNYLIKLGVESSRIRTVSYGEERPLFTGSEEEDYAYNRRDDFILE